MTKDPVYEALKLVVLLQSAIEVMDDLKGTSLYRHDVKMAMNNLNNKVERHIKPQLDSIDENPETSRFFDEVKFRVDVITEAPLENLVNLAMNEDEPE